MSESVSLPALGESVTEGTVTRWLKAVGDRVEIDEPLLEVSTDKVDTEIPSPIAGVIEAILVAEDETVEVGTPLVVIGDGPSAASEPAPPAEDASVALVTAPPVVPQTPVAFAPEPAAFAPPPVAVVPAPVVFAPVAVVPVAVVPVAVVPVAPITATVAIVPAPVAFAVPVHGTQPVTELPSASGSIAALPPLSASESPSSYVTPLVRKLAHDKGVDLTELSGSGVGGRIRKEDILAAVAAPETAAPESLDTTIVAPVTVSPLRGTSVPMSRLRRVIAERAVISMQTSAQLTSVVEVDVTLIARLRDTVKTDFQAKTGHKLSSLPFFALSAAEALKSFPIINATIDGDTIVYPAQENIAIAVDTDRGLLTPVIRDAGSLDLAGLATQIADLAARTRDNKLTPDELAGGTFTLTNTGSRGALFDTPIVFLPQSAILGTGIVSKKPIVVTTNGFDAIAIRSTVYLALSYDHRIIDGADAARFLVAMKDRLEGGNFAASLGI